MGLSACDLDFSKLDFRRKRRSSRSPGRTSSGTAILLWLWAASWPCRRTARSGHPSAASATLTTWFSFPWRAWAAVCPRRWCPVPPLDSLASSGCRRRLRPLNSSRSSRRRLRRSLRQGQARLERPSGRRCRRRLARSPRGGRQLARKTRRRRSTLRSGGHQGTWRFLQHHPHRSSLLPAHLQGEGWWSRSHVRCQSRGRMLGL